MKGTKFYTWVDEIARQASTFFKRVSRWDQPNTVFYCASFSDLPDKASSGEKRSRGGVP
jgi:hypothetical protein